MFTFLALPIYVRVENLFLRCGTHRADSAAFDKMMIGRGDLQLNVNSRQRRMPWYSSYSQNINFGRDEDFNL
jgi:hypothetical protein